MLEIKNLKKSYDGITILHDINLAIDDGEIVSILGPSGCSKTTLLNLILGLTDADGGEILFQGENMLRVPMEQRGFNIVFQDYALFPNLNAYQNITYGLKNKPGISSQDEVDDLIELLGLKEHLDKKIEQLSGGQKQRVSIARAMTNNPSIILADEPTGALDSKTGRRIMDIFHRLNQEEGKTIVLITHSNELAEETQRIVTLKDGEIIGERKGSAVC